jgi:ACS family tartrate transporter-like MFS transporter
LSRTDFQRPRISTVAPESNPALHLADHTRRIISLRLLPFVFVLYIVNYLDRTNVAYAALEMSHDLGFSDRVFGLGAGIFFISYVALQIPGALLVERWSARRAISVIMIVWGSLTILTALVHTAGQLYLARFALGAAEAGFFPGVVVYLSHWFTRQDRCKAGSHFMAAVPLSFIIGSPLAGWILGHHWLGMQGWRWLFVLEGLPAILFGMVAFFYLTDWPNQAAWLAPGERQWITGKLEAEKPANRNAQTIWKTLRCRPVLLFCAAAFFEYFFAYTAVFWIPTILKRTSGLSDARVGWLGAVPYAVSLIAMLLISWHSDKVRERRWHAAFPVFAAAVGLLGLLTLPHTTALIVAMFSLVSITQAFLPVLFAMPTELFTESAAATAVGLTNAAGSVAGFAGPYVFGYLLIRTGSYTTGFVVMLACAVVSVLLLLSIPKPGARDSVTV